VVHEEVVVRGRHNILIFIADYVGRIWGVSLPRAMSGKDGVGMHSRGYSGGGTDRAQTSSEARFKRVRERDDGADGHLLQARRSASVRVECQRGT
jgi:hypothetical protein